MPARAQLAVYTKAQPGTLNHLFGEVLADEGVHVLLQCVYFLLGRIRL